MRPIRTPGRLALVVLLVALGHGQEQSRFPKLFKQLTSSHTTNKAAKEWLQLAKTDPAATKYLAAELPRLIENGPSSPEQWNNAVQLADKLKIVEAAPALAKWISSQTGEGSTTMRQALRLEHFPAGKALVKIGDPSIPALKVILDRGNLRDRESAVSVLNHIDSKIAKSALREHLKRESNPELRSQIEKILAK